MVGPVLGGILIAAQGPDLAYWLNAATFVLSAALLARIPALRLQTGTVESRGHWRDIGDGIQVVLRSRALLVVLVVWNVVMLGNAAINVAEVVLAKVVAGQRRHRLRRPGRRGRARSHARQLRVRDALSTGSGWGGCTRSGSR